MQVHDWMAQLSEFRRSELAAIATVKEMQWEGAMIVMDRVFVL
jgi:hypothetical protein